MAANYGIVGGTTQTGVIPRKLALPIAPNALYGPYSPQSGTAFAPAATTGVAHGTAIPNFTVGAELTSVVVSVGTAQTASTMRLGVYASRSTDGAPIGPPLLDAPVDVSSTGLKQVVLNRPVLITSDLLWLFVAPTAASMTARLAGYNNNSASDRWYLLKGQASVLNTETQRVASIAGRSCADGFPENPTISWTQDWGSQIAWLYMVSGTFR